MYALNPSSIYLLNNAFRGKIEIDEINVNLYKYSVYGWLTFTRGQFIVYHSMLVTITTNFSYSFTFCLILTLIFKTCICASYQSKEESWTLRGFFHNLIHRIPICKCQYQKQFIDHLHTLSISIQAKNNFISWQMVVKIPNFYQQNFLIRSIILGT